MRSAGRKSAPRCKRWITKHSSPAVLALDELPVQRALARHDLIFKLHDWQAQQQSGTRRDFALFARGDTKAAQRRANGTGWNP